MTSATGVTGESLRCLEGGDDCTGAVELREPLSGTGVSFARCGGHWSKRLDLQDRLRRDYPDSPVPPRWYVEQGGEAYAGERWDEDD